MGFLNKSGKSDIAVWILVGIVALMVFSPSTITSITGQEPAQEQLGDIVAGVCSDPSNTFTFEPLYTKWGSQITTGENIHWWKNGVSQGTKAVASTTTLNNGDELAFVTGIDSSTYYANYFEATMPCGPTDLGNLAPNNEHQLITADADFSITLFNSDDGNLNTINTANETIGTGEYGQWEVKIDGTSEQGISPKGDIWFVLGYNKGNFSASSVTLGGKSPDSVSVPSWFTTNSIFDYKVFLLDGCPTGDSKICQIRPGDLYIEAKDGVDPSAPGSTYADFLNITILNEDYDIDTNSNQILGGGTPVIEDNDGTRSGFAYDGLSIWIG